MVQTAPRRLEPRELPVPDVRDDTAILRVEACGICGSDYEQFEGVLRTPTPVIPGHEPLGVIEKIGDAAAKRWGVDVGDRVAVVAAESIEAVTAIEAAERFGLTVWASASLFQARLARRFPREFVRALGGLRTDAQRAIQFVRSAPGVKVALVGCARPGHAAENLEVALAPPIPPRQFLSRFFGNG